MNFFTKRRKSPNYFKRPQKQAIWIVILISFVVVAIGFITFYLVTSYKLNHLASKPGIVADWKAQHWDDVLSKTTNSLQVSPLDPFYLGFAGLAAFYKAVDMPESDERRSLFDDSIEYLRKALLSNLSGLSLPRAELEYVLGKAYYFRGDTYFDEAIKYLEQSIHDGYTGTDTYEYLALSYSGIKDSENALKNFELALKTNKNEYLAIAAASANTQAGRLPLAEQLLVDVLNKTQDAVIRENARLALATVYINEGQLNKAEEIYNLAITDNPDLAEAHYQLGLLYQKAGDAVKARAEWRKTVSIDPGHAGARQKLTEK